MVVADVNVVGGEESVAQVQAQGGRAMFVRADVEGWIARAMVAAAEDEFGGLHVLFNDPGIMDASDDDAVNTEEAVWDLTMNINLKGVFLGCKIWHPSPAPCRGRLHHQCGFVCGPLGRGHTSTCLHRQQRRRTLHDTGAAVKSTTQGKYPGQCQTCPGPLRTELLMKFLNTEEKRQRRLVHIPMGRFGEAVGISRSALFLASDESSFVTGSTFTVDGGITAAYVTPE